MERLSNIGASQVVGPVTIAANGAAVLGDTDAQYFQSITFQISGTWAGTISFEVSMDGTTWHAKQLVTASGGVASSATSSNTFSGDIGARYFRVRATAWTSGTASIVAEFSAFSLSNNIGTQSVQGGITVTPNQNEQTETSTNLGANALYTGGTRDNGGTTTASRRTLVRPMIMHNAGTTPGTLILQESENGTTWRETRRVPVPSDSSYRTFEWPLHLRYYRLLFQNGATAQTGFFLQSLLVQGEAGTMDAKNNLSFLLSASALAASGTFTSPTLDLGDNHIWDTVRLRVHTDQASATDGIRIETSHDGTNWGYSQAAAITKTADARIVGVERPITERYIRLVVANGTTAQTFLRATLALVSL